MKEFKDLVFNVHPSMMFNTQAKMEFDNGYGISVITGRGAYGNETHPYEVAVLKDGFICYNTPITNDVIGWLDAKGVTEIMKKIQELPKV